MFVSGLVWQQCLLGVKRKKDQKKAAFTTCCATDKLEGTWSRNASEYWNRFSNLVARRPVQLLKTVYTSAKDHPSQAVKRCSWLGWNQCTFTRLFIEIFHSPKRALFSVSLCPLSALTTTRYLSTVSQEAWKRAASPPFFTLTIPPVKSNSAWRHLKRWKKVSYSGQGHRFSSLFLSLWLLAALKAEPVRRAKRAYI